MDNLINTSFVSPSFSSTQPTGSNTPIDTSGKSSGQDQGKSGPVTTTSGTTSTNATLQSTQGQTTGQNINATLGQALGTIQGSMADANSTQRSDDEQDVNTGDAPQVVDTGLSTDQQVTGQQKSRDRGSHTGSGGQSGKDQDIYMGTAASGLQKGQGIKSATSTDFTKAVSNFTLKVDTSDFTSSIRSTQSSTSYVDSNGAPTLPPGPNVFAMVADCTDLSSNLQEWTVSSMVAANNGMNSTLAKDYSNQITAIQNAVANQAKSNAKSSTLKTFSWVTDAVMLAVAVVTLDPVLLAVAIGSCLMTQYPQMTSGLSNALQQMGIPPEVANIMATMILIGAFAVGGMGVGAVAEGAMMAGSAAAIEATSQTATEAAVDTAADSGDVAGDAASKAAAKSIDWTATWEALGSSEGRSAFLKGATQGAGKVITDAPENIGTAIANIPSSVADSATGLYEFASTVSTYFKSLGEKSLSEILIDIGLATASASEGSSTTVKDTTTATENFMHSTQESIKSLFSNLSSMDPAKMVRITADLTMASLQTTGAGMQFSAAELKKAAEDSSAGVTQSQATTESLGDQINLSNQQLQAILQLMNTSVIEAGTTLSQYGSLSSETLGQSNRSAA